MQEALSSDARNRIMRAMSSSLSAIERSIWLERIRWLYFAANSGSTPSGMKGLSMSPLPASGQTAFTRMPNFPSSSAATRVMPRSAHLVPA